MWRITLANIIPEGKERFEELDTGSSVKLLILKLAKLLEWSIAPEVGIKEYTAFSKLFESGLVDLSRVLAEYLKEEDNSE